MLLEASSAVSYTPRLIHTNFISEASMTAPASISILSALPSPPGVPEKTRACAHRFRESD